MPVGHRLARLGRRCGLALVLLVVSCDGCDRSRAYCRLGAERTVARTRAKQIDAIAMVPLGDAAVAFWSLPGGLFGRKLGPAGSPRGPRRRLGVRCQGGLAAVSGGEVAHVACLLRPVRGKQQDRGGVLLHRIDPSLRVRQTRRLGHSGTQSAGVALAIGPAGLELAWHDGSSAAHRVHWASLADAAPPPRVVSQPGRLARAPALAAYPPRERDGEGPRVPARPGTLLAWSESWFEAGELQNRIAAWDVHGGTPRTLRRHAPVDAAPALFRAGPDLALAYRDRTSASAKAGLYVTRLAEPHAAAAPPGQPETERARPREVSPPVRVGRADGAGVPALCACMGGAVVATPRTYGGDYFVGVNFLDERLARVRGEQQFYEDSRAFAQVASACLGDHALFLIAEFPQLERETATLRAIPYRRTHDPGRQDRPGTLW